MTDRNIELTRRKILASVGAVGAAGAGAGLGTSALFSDEEAFEDNVITAGTLDLLIDYYSYWDLAGTGQAQGTKNGDGTVSGTLTDVKPGDNGLLTFCPRIETNPAYLWLCGELTANDENSVTEPEAGADPNNDTVDTDGDIDGEGELAENVEITVSYCELDDDVADGDGFEPDDVSTTDEVWTGTLAEFFAAIEAGVPLDGDASGSGFSSPGEQACFAGTDDEDSNPCLCIEWEVPVEVGNEIQSDSVEFDLTFSAQQCRNNDGTNNPCCSCGPDEYAVEVPGGGTTCVTEFSGEGPVEDIYAYEPGPTFSSTNPDIQTADTANVFVYRNENNDDRSLVIVNDARDDEGGVASFDIDFENSGSYTWVVQDDEEEGTTDQYSTGGSSADADWTWAGGKTDGGAVGYLNTQFDIDLAARFNGSADIPRGFGGSDNDITTWQVIQPDGSPVELASGIGEDDGEYTARLFRCSD